VQSTQVVEQTEGTRADGVPLTGIPRRTLPWALFLVAVAAAGVFAYLWQSAVGSEADTSALRAEARRFVLALTNFGSETIERDVDRIRSFAAGPFADEVDELFGAEIIAAIETAEATSTGHVEEIFVQEMEGNSASVFAVVSEEVRNKNMTEPRTDVVRMEIGLIRLHDWWKIDRVNLFQTQANP
jgi:hypothetical protein